MMNPLYSKALWDLLPLNGVTSDYCGLPINKALKQNLIAYVPQTEDVDWQFPISIYDVIDDGTIWLHEFLTNPKSY